MDVYLLIAVIFCLSYGIESVFGLGGSVLAVALLSLFLDIKLVTPLTIFSGIIASIFVLSSDLKSFDKKMFGKIMLFALPGVIIGALFLKEFSTDLVVSIFAWFLILYAAWTILSPAFRVGDFFKPIGNFCAGIIGGMFGGPGPMIVVTMKDAFANKSVMRATLAGIFIAIHAIRMPFYMANGLLDYAMIRSFAWIVIPLSLTIWLGHKIHVKISKKVFDLGISILLGGIGIWFLIS